MRNAMYNLAFYPLKIIYDGYMLCYQLIINQASTIMKD